jgi:hypothetical protein
MIKLQTGICLEVIDKWRQPNYQLPEDGRPKSRNVEYIDTLDSR